MYYPAAQNASSVIRDREGAAILHHVLAHAPLIAAFLQSSSFTERLTESLKAKCLRTMGLRSIRGVENILSSAIHETLKLQSSGMFVLFI
jgi:hypothetical protein